MKKLALVSIVGLAITVLGFTGFSGKAAKLPVNTNAIKVETIKINTVPGERQLQDAATWD